RVVIERPRLGHGGESAARDRLAVVAAALGGRRERGRAWLGARRRAAEEPPEHRERRPVPRHGTPGQGPGNPDNVAAVRRRRRARGIATVMSTTVHTLHAW